MKNNIENAVSLQRRALVKEIPNLNKLEFTYVYEPLNEVSGDFYDFYKVNDEFIIGILFDVMGNGVSAALSVFALKILFNEATLKYKDPVKIVNYINKKSIEYLSEIYTSSICFSFDLRNSIAKIASAGINRFIHLDRRGKYKEIIIKGSPLGMLDINAFDEKIIYFHPNDMFIFFTDGIEVMFLNNIIHRKLCKINYLNEISDFFHEFIKNNKIKDDCTIIAFKIK